MRLFVFSSNEAGIYSFGMALFAKQAYNAIEGIGFGITGEAFSIPVKDWELNNLKYSEIKHYVDRFIAFCRYKSNYHFDLTKIGSETENYVEENMAVLFVDAPENVHLINKQFKSICLAKDWIKNIEKIC